MQPLSNSRRRASWRASDSTTRAVGGQHLITACCRLRACGASSQPAGSSRGTCGDPDILCGIVRYGWPGGRFGNTITLCEADAYQAAAGIRTE